MYLDDSLPYAFFNARGELVGFDVEMGLQLARDLQVTAEFVPVDRSILQNGLEAGVCDLVMSGVAITADRSIQLQFSSSYLDETVAFVVPDHLVGTSPTGDHSREGRLRVACRARQIVQKVRTS